MWSSWWCCVTSWVWSWAPWVCAQTQTPPIAPAQLTAAAPSSWCECRHVGCWCFHPRFGSLTRLWLQGRGFQLPLLLAVHVNCAGALPCGGECLHSDLSALEDRTAATGITTCILLAHLQQRWLFWFFGLVSPQFIDTPGLIPELNIGPALGLKDNLTISEIYKWVTPVHVSKEETEYSCVLYKFYLFCKHQSYEKSLHPCLQRLWKGRSPVDNNPPVWTCKPGRAAKCDKSERHTQTGL